MFEAFLLYVITCIWANIEWYFRMGYGKIRQGLSSDLQVVYILMNTLERQYGTLFL